MTHRLAFAFLASAACMHSSGNDGAAADNVTLAEEYGFCASACYRELGITADGTAHIVVREARDKQILNERSVQLSDDETGRVLGLYGDAA